MKLNVKIMPKNGVLDPQGKAIENSLNQLGFNNFSEIRQGKIIEIDIDEEEGICNGFQILTESGLLPGTLIRNDCLSFLCKTVSIRVENNETKFSNKYKQKEIINIPIAHNEGNFFANEDTLKKIKDSNQIIFKYCDQNGEVNEKSNPNGSIENIAGITNEKGNVLGMMPHPERATCKITKLTDGENLFKSIYEFLS